MKFILHSRVFAFNGEINDFVISSQFELNQTRKKIKIVVVQFVLRLHFSCFNLHIFSYFTTYILVSLRRINVLNGKSVGLQFPL